MLLTHFLLPLLVGACMPLFSYNASKKILLGFSLVHVAIAFTLYTHLTPPVVYQLGNWETSLGISLTYHSLNLFLILFFSLCFMGLVVVILNNPTIDEVVGSKTLALIVMSFAGFNALLVTDDFFNFYVFMELTSITTYLIIALANKKALSQQALSAYYYIIIGTLGASFYVIGVSFLYLEFGTLNITLITKMGASHTGYLNSVAFSFIIIGLIAKVGLFPFHQWVPMVYGRAPHFLFIFLSALSTKVFLYFIIQLKLAILPFIFPQSDWLLYSLFTTFGFFGFFLFTFIASQEQSVKTLLAYSSLSQIALFFISLATQSADTLTASLYIYCSHSVIVLVLMSSLNLLFNNSAAIYIINLKGLFYKHPLISSLFIYTSLSIVGLPGTLGFIGKMLLFKTMYQEQHYIEFFLLSLSTIMSLLYVFKMIIMMIQPPSLAEEHNHTSPQPLQRLNGIYLIAIFAIMLYFSFNTQQLTLLIS